MKNHLKLLRESAFGLFLAVVAFFPVLARADGGVVRVRATQGPFIVTLFSPAEISAGAPTDVTVMVQKSKTGEIVMDATVDVSIVAPSGAKIHPGDPFCSSPGVSGLPAMETAASSATFRATRAHASNKLLYGLPIILHAPGSWRLNANVRAGGEEVVVGCLLPVAIAPGRASSVWFCIALPFCIIGLFALNQMLRRRPMTMFTQAA